MIDLLLWYLVISILGLVTFPVAFSLFPGLKDRGYSLSRVLGLLVWSYLFWLLSSTGWLINDRGSILMAAGGLVGVSLFLLRAGQFQIIARWLADQRSMVIWMELVFLAAFALMALIRSTNPEITATEKPMELAFINAIQRSPTMPPHDPWLSGYAISYYYFGFLQVSMLAKLLGTASGIAFNLGITLIFGLSALAGYGLVVNLLSAYRPVLSRSRIFISSLLGPLFLLIVSNLGGMLEVFHARGLFWSRDETGAWSSVFWQWLDLKDLNQPPAEPLGWLPTRYLWWWRSSRIVRDFDLAGQPIEIIDEFPFFSFLLADLHPHVLAIPFALLAVGLALNVFLGGAHGEIRLGNFGIFLRKEVLLLAMLSLGALAFLNTWDFPIYAAVFAGAYALRRAETSGWGSGRIVDFLGTGALIAIGGVLLYLPFFVGFQSQAGGILPNIYNPTRGAHLWVMFLTLLLPIFIYLLYLLRHLVPKPDLRFGVLTTVIFLLGLFLAALLFGFGLTYLPGIGAQILSSLGSGSRLEILSVGLERRLLQPGGLLTLAFLLVFSLALLKPRQPARTGETIESRPLEASPHHQIHRFVVFLILAGSLLVLIPDFFFLRDLFNNRMNTIFKFYYQAWILWAIAAAFGSVFLLSVLRGLATWIFRFTLTLVLAAGVMYPLLSLNTKTNGFSPPGGFTLDGTAYLARQSPDEDQAFLWLKQVPLGTISEAVGGSYSTFARVATHTGLPTVLGWPFHELQWRGSAQAQGSRELDIERLYCTSDWNEASAILEQYDINYVYLGPLEYSKYTTNSVGCPTGLQEAKFNRHLELIYQNEAVRIYRVPKTSPTMLRP